MVCLGLEGNRNDQNNKIKIRNVRHLLLVVENWKMGKDRLEKRLKNGSEDDESSQSFDTAARGKPTRNSV